MERNSVPGDGTQGTSWHTCIAAGCNDTIFWDVEGNNYGTPKATNLSENDLRGFGLTPMNLEHTLEPKNDYTAGILREDDLRRYS
jgi:hypothetical protein